VRDRARALWIGIGVVAVVVLLALAGCAGSDRAEQQGTPTAVRTKKPTFTPMPPATDTPTITPLPTATPEPPTPTPTATAIPTDTPVPPTAAASAAGYISGLADGAVALFEVEVFSAPGGAASAKLRHGAAVELGEVKDGHVQVKSGDVQGWVKEANVAKEAPAAPTTMYINARDAANIRRAPNGQVVKSVKRGAEVYRFECQGEWCRIGIPGEASTLWVHESLLSASPV